ncbi:hypothetical protein D3C80_1487520 [compost metagenome]
MTMVLSYESKQIRNICNKEVVAQQSLPRHVVTMLIRRLADLRAVSNLHDLLAGNPRECSALPPGEYIIDLCDGYSLIFRSSHLITPILSTGKVDWSKVDRIKILRIQRI